MVDPTDAWKRLQPTVQAELRARMRELRRQIEAYPYWGAAIGEMAEEHDEIAGRLGEPKIRTIGEREDGQ